MRARAVAVHGSVFLTRNRDVTGELSVLYMRVGIKRGGAGVAMAPHFPAIVVYQSLYGFCGLTFVHGCGCTPLHLISTSCMYAKLIVDCRSVVYA